MAKGSLTQGSVDKGLQAGLHRDGDGLYLQVTGPESRSWIFRYSFRGKPRWLGLGSTQHVTLAAARNARDDARTEIRRGVDPVAARKEQRAQERIGTVKRVSFRERAEQYIQAHEEGWRNQKHREQWRASLKAYAYPIIGELAASEVAASHLVEILRPIWSEKPETARRLRGRIEAVLDYAADPDDMHYRNPAAMTAQLLKKLPRPSASKNVQNHPSLSYEEIGPFMAALREREGIAARALEFVIATAARTGEVLGARWNEMDIAGAVWTVPAERMKGAREHRVPLSAIALKALKAMQAVKQGEVVFPSLPHDRPLSNMALLTVLRRMNRADLTVHGFRSTFRTWAAEQTTFPREVAEAALAHVLKDKTEKAYQRGDLFEKRRRLMIAWAEYIARPAGRGEVVPMRAHG